jgi:hypothetical protein
MSMPHLKIICNKPCCVEIEKKISSICKKFQLKFNLTKEEKKFIVVVNGHCYKENGDFEPIDSLPYKKSQNGLKALSELLYNYQHE